MTELNPGHVGVMAVLCRPRMCASYESNGADGGALSAPSMAQITGCKLPRTQLRPSLNQNVLKNPVQLSGPRN